MDYSKHYQQLITKHGSTNKPDNANYYEKHHVIPKSLGGSDDADNLVYLTGKAHYVAHYLLFKIHGIGPMSHAFWVMSAMDKTGKRHVPNGLSFEVARKAKADTLRGVPMKPHTKAKLSKALTGLVRSPDTCRRIGLSKEGVVASLETRAKMSAAKTGHRHNLAKPANVYCAKTDELLASNVIIKVWCDRNGYTSGALHKTAKADRTKPHKRALNSHYHKGIYAVYIDKE